MLYYRQDPESKVAYGDRVHIGHKHDRAHVCYIKTFLAYIFYNIVN